MAAALQVVSDRLSSPVLQKLCTMFNLKGSLQKLLSTMPTFVAFVEDEQQEVGNNGGAVGIGSPVLKEVAYDAEDLLDMLVSNNNGGFVGFGEQRSGHMEPDLLETQYADGLKEMILVLQGTVDEVLHLNFMVGGGL